MAETDIVAVMGYSMEYAAIAVYLKPYGNGSINGHNHGRRQVDGTRRVLDSDGHSRQQIDGTVVDGS